MRPLLVLVLLSAPAAGVVAAQSPCEGNGLGVTLGVTPAYVGEAMAIDVASPASPGGLGLVAYAGQVGPITVPGLGPSCLDVFSSPFGIVPLALDGAGEAHVAPLLPSDPALLGAPPLFLSAAAIVGTEIGLSKTVPLWFAQHDSWFPAGTLSAPRGFLRATALGDGPTADRIGVFVSGGGDQSLVEPGSQDDTWLFEPFTRTFAAGPPLSVPRNFHAQTLLADGRVLITGGCDASGVVHASAEIYDPTTNTIAPCASMTAPRSGHAATLLQDGRVLVTGGLADFQDAKAAFAAAMDTAQDTAELYDPVSDLWIPVGTPMASPRAGHGQALWSDGRVLVISGAYKGSTDFYGQETAEYTSSADWFDPAAGTFAPAPPLGETYSGRSNFSLSFRADGELVIAGGMSKGASTGSFASSDLSRFGATWWGQYAGSLPEAVAFSTQATLPDGRVLVIGGFTGFLDHLEASEQAVSATGDPCAYGTPCEVVEHAPIGTAAGLPGPVSPRGGHAMVELFDGTSLVVGGLHGSDTTPVGTWALDDAWIYAP